MIGADTDGARSRSMRCKHDCNYHIEICYLCTIASTDGPRSNFKIELRMYAAAHVHLLQGPSSTSLSDGDVTAVYLWWTTRWVAGHVGDMYF